MKNEVPMLAPSSVAAEYWSARRSVTGAFWDMDFALFDQVLTWQRAAGIRGDLLEIGALYGKSAILIGLHAEADEEVVICDVFEDSGLNEANDIENAASYPGLARDTFEANYSTWVDAPPRVVQELSHGIANHVPNDAVRFAHIDGGHHYDVVSADLANTRALMASGGVVVVDDYRAIHTPGVAAAAWHAVTERGLIPVCGSEQKLYAAWEAVTATALRAHLSAWLQPLAQELNVGVQDVAGSEFLIVGNPRVRGGRAAVTRMLPPALKEAVRPPARPYLGRPL